ncbi:MAG: DNA-processing protein DprA, partial [Gemmatimonadales bacterium]
VVGSRHPTSYGIEVTAALAAGLSQAGIVVVSGMARGLDAVAHWAAVRNGGLTVGVLGNGLGVIYPAANAALYQRVGEEGLLLTEFPPGERPHAGSFPRRNRLISGLARVTVVVEAAERSGTLRTASAALDQGREVLAVPGPITSRTSVGTNQLLRASGAGPYLQLDDVLAFFPEVKAPTSINGSGPSLAAAAALREDLRLVFDALDGAVRTVDGLADELRLEPATVLRAVSELEIVGLAEAGAGGFRRAR